MYGHAEVGFIFVLMIKNYDYLNMYVSGLYDDRHEIIIRWRVCF